MSIDQHTSKIEAQTNQPHQGEHSIAGKLWEAVYDHPIATAATVAGTVAGVGLLALTRGYGASILSSLAARNVLLVEDGFFGKAVEATMKENGSMFSFLTGPRITRVSGITSLDPVMAKTVEGASVPLDLTRFNVALVNGKSMSSGAVDAGDLAAALERNHITTIATSLDRATNQAMLERGADVVVPKSTLLPAVMDGQLDLRTAALAPERAQASVDALTEQLADRANPLRKAADAKLMEFVNQG